MAAASCHLACGGGLEAIRFMECLCGMVSTQWQTEADRLGMLFPYHAPWITLRVGGVSRLLLRLPMDQCVNFCLLITGVFCGFGLAGAFSFWGFFLESFFWFGPFFLFGVFIHLPFFSLVNCIFFCDIFSFCDRQKSISSAIDFRVPCDIFVKFPKWEILAQLKLWVGQKLKNPAKSRKIGEFRKKPANFAKNRVFLRKNAKFGKKSQNFAHNAQEMAFFGHFSAISPKNRPFWANIGRFRVFSRILPKISGFFRKFP
ncbi:MAG: hypothetical protein IJU53_10990 [Thermoguttaceae bacterium]|nr:hypothetical protein [Thermoguttaceae bacterium]